MVLNGSVLNGADFKMGRMIVAILLDQNRTANSTKDILDEGSVAEGTVGWRGRKREMGYHENRM